MQTNSVVRTDVPLDLPRLLMRRAGVVALAVLLLALVLGLARMRTDIDDEFDAAVSLAGLLAELGSLAPLDDAAALAKLAALRSQAAASPPRHLLLQVYGVDGQVLLAPPAAAPAAAPMRWLLALHRQLWSAPAPHQQTWPLARPGGGRWTVSLLASHESERREALVNLLGTLALLLACIAGLLLVMRWNLRRALAPLGRLLAAISGIEGHDVRAVQALPAMPVRELDAIAGALRRLGQALDEAQARRRLLSQQVLSLQEDERSRLAQELHDEFGQRLTALRVDAAWLARRLDGQPEAAAVLAGMAGHCQQIQQDIRGLLSRLQPFGRATAAGLDGTGQSLARLTDLLQALVASWAQAGDGATTRYRIELAVQNEAGQHCPWPDPALAQTLVLPQALALVLYRISQEALTNVTRHAGAQQAVLRLLLTGRLQPGAPLRIAWAVLDDGIGLVLPAVAQQRGNGLSGIRERVWAQGAELVFQPGLQGRGLGLAASFELRWGPSPAAT